MPTGAVRLPRAARVMADTSPGRQPPFVSHNTTMSAPAFSAACHVAIAYSPSSLWPSKPCSAS